MIINYLVLNKSIIFRELVQNDFGIDGEVEMVQITENKKKYATGEILKVQIKSTESHGSYIRSETDTSFKYYASVADLKYWSNISGDVVLIIYDGRIDKLYAKTIPDFNTSKIGNSDSVAIEFDKEKNGLNIEENRFVEVFSSSFHSRVNFNQTDVLGSNMCKLFAFPKAMYVYETYFTNKRSVYDVIDDSDSPLFSLNGNKIYSFYEINTKSFSKFHTTILEKSRPAIYDYSQVFADDNLRRQYSLNLNLFLREHLRSEGIIYNRKYRRYFFKLYNGETYREVSYKTRVHKNEREKPVVKHYTYGKDSFYRHLAFDFSYEYTSEGIYLVLNPKYLFTTDGYDTISPKKITKYTNFLTMREFNNAVINQIHFLFDFLCNGRTFWEVYNYNAIRIQVQSPRNFTAPFSIFGLESNSRQQSLIDDENLLF